MSKTKQNTLSASDNAEEYMVNLIAEFSVDGVVDWLRRKFDGFDFSSRASLPLGDTKNEREYFAEIERLGYVTRLPGGKKDDTNRPLLTVAIKMKKDLSERTSRLVQFNLAKKLLKEAVERGGHNLTGLPSQGLFFFYDTTGHFRISFVSGDVENRRFKFNEAKRQSFYAVPGAPNNIIKRRLNPKFSTFADVKEAFSVEALTKEFYNALFDWYQWVMDPKTGITFPNDPDTPDDDRKQLSEAIIRLITRLMFVWFIKQKGIVPDVLFQRTALMDIIRDFQPESMEQDNYYRVILQNLFFATLNCQPDKRKYVKSFHGMSNEQGVKTCYRYKEELLNQDAFLEMMHPVPFLNCALFDCLDKKKDEKRGTPEILLDGFSSKKPRQAHVPNGLFFDEKRGLVKLFNLYEFTVDENNADDSDVALDPELLGKVFENLLGAFNPETQETARKATGSFYTPREIVDYMVEESLRNYLKTKVPAADDARLDDLFDRNKAAEGVPVLFNAAEITALLNALYSCKILDPACGSGAFPMGVLHCMVRLFGRLDPRNIAQREKLMERYRADSVLEENNPSDEDRKERAETLEKQMREGQMFPDYARKLYLIENCIYGVDIQPIATQISKLRFFISLLCDQLRSSYNPKNENYGLLSLPNLEAKFVCANTLLPLPKLSGSDLALSTGNILELRQMLQQNRHDIFNARTARTKAKYKERDLEIRDAIRSSVRTTLTTPDKQVIADNEALIVQALKEREAVAEPKIQLHEELVGADLFSAGHKEWVETDVNAAPRREFDCRIANAKRIIQEEKNKVHQATSTELDRLAAMVAGWDPYDQNACSNFFDPEWMFNVKGGFDIVIGNPPYIQVPKGIFSTIDFPYSEGRDQGKQNLYKVFVEAAYNLSKAETGIACLIVQSSLMGDMSAKFTRRLLLEKTSIEKLVEFPKNAPTVAGKIFKAVLQGTCIVIFRKSMPCTKHVFKISIGNDRTTMAKLSFENIVQNDIVCFYPEYYEIPLIRRGEASIISKVKASKKHVRDFIFDEAQGNINTIHLARIQSQQTSGAYIAKGAHIHRWYLDPELFNCKETPETKRLFAQNENHFLILSQNISGTTDRYRINSTSFVCRNTKIVFLDTANILYLRCPDDMKYITAILNSTITDWIFRKTSTNNHLNMYELEAIPVPDSSDNRMPIISLVDQILALKASDPQADTSELEAEIDKLVYELYGLTKEEIAVVEASGKGAVEGGEAETTIAPKTAKTPGKKKHRRSDDDYLE